MAQALTREIAEPMKIAAWNPWAGNLDPL